MLTRLIAVIILQYIQISNHVTHTLYMSIIFNKYVNKQKRKRRTKLGRERGTHEWLGTVLPGVHGTRPKLTTARCSLHHHHPLGAMKKLL